MEIERHTIMKALHCVLNGCAEGDRMNGFRASF